MQHFFDLSLPDWSLFIPKFSYFLFLASSFVVGSRITLLQPVIWKLRLQVRSLKSRSVVCNLKQYHQLLTLINLELSFCVISIFCDLISLAFIFICRFYSQNFIIGKSLLEIINDQVQVLVFNMIVVRLKTWKRIHFRRCILCYNDCLFTSREGSESSKTEVPGAGIFRSSIF